MEKAYEEFLTNICHFQSAMMIITSSNDYFLSHESHVLLGRVIVSFSLDIKITICLILSLESHLCALLN